LTKSQLQTTHHHHNQNNYSQKLGKQAFTAHTSTLQRQQLPVKEMFVDALNPIDPNFAYMLIYINCNNIQTFLQSSKLTNKLLVCSTFSNKSYDSIKIHFVLKSIEDLLTKCTKEFLVSITTSCLNSNQSYSSYNACPGSRNNLVYSVHNEKLLDLIMRHLKSIYGVNFFSSASFDLNRINFNLNSTTYIEAITIILLFYVRSYYPPSRFVLTTSNNSSNNNNTNINLLDKNNALNLRKSHSSASLQSNQSQQSSSNNSILFVESPIDYTMQTKNDEELFNENRNIQVFALKVLTKLIKELINQSKSIPKINNSSYISGSNLGTSSNNYLANSLVWYQSISDLLEKTKLQKTLLHCFYSTIFTPTQNTLSHCILSYASANKQAQFTYVCELMNCLENLIELEKILNDYQLIVKYQKVGTILNSVNSSSSSGALRQNQSKFSF
jgi:hypothetical protein